jgi:hypothetical protein
VTRAYVQPNPAASQQVVAPVAPASAVHNWLKTGSIVSSAVAFVGGVISYVTSLPSTPVVKAEPPAAVARSEPYVQPPPAASHPATTPVATPPYVQPPPPQHVTVATPDPTCAAILALLQAQQHAAVTPPSPSLPYVQPPPPVTPGPSTVAISPTLLGEAATELESYADAIDEPKRITPGVPPYWTVVLLPKGVTDPKVAVASIRETAKTLRASGARASP